MIQILADQTWPLPCIGRPEVSLIEGLQRGQCGLYQDSTVSFRKVHPQKPSFWLLITKWNFILQCPCFIGHEKYLSEDKAGSVALFSPNCWICLYNLIPNGQWVLYAPIFHMISLVSHVKRRALLTALSPGEVLLRHVAIYHVRATTYWRNNFLTRCQSFDSARLAGVPAAAWGPHK